MLKNKIQHLKNIFLSKKSKILILTIFLFWTFLGVCLGETVENEKTPYLQYQEPKQQPAGDLFSAGSHIFSLLATFLLVLALAYFTSKLVANKMKFSAGNKDAKILSTLSFGSGKGIYLVEFAGKYLILGVTEQSINLLKELSDAEEIEKMQIDSFSLNESFDSVFRRQISSLQGISQKFPSIFSGTQAQYDLSEQERNEKISSRLTTAAQDNREKR